MGIAMDTERSWSSSLSEGLCKCDNRERAASSEYQVKTRKSDRKLLEAWQENRWESSAEPCETVEQAW